jgi:multimeric flavodoxin WrbA
MKKIRDKRRDYICKIFAKISEYHAYVVAKNLKVMNMSAPFKGTIDYPWNKC